MKIPSCPFCVDPSPIFEDDFAFARYDLYPVSNGHLLVIPKRHFADYFECNAEEQNSLWGLVRECKTYLDKKYSPDGFNIGINVGPVAGQTVPHLHIHVIPRYAGDMPDPRGGVRGVIPEKQRY